MLETKIKIDNINNQLTTTSLNVCEVFNKTHKNVLRALESLECSNKFRLAHFCADVYLDQYGREQKLYKMDKDGFVLLVMGFTGVKATQFKEAYINAFNEMEQTLKQKQQSTLIDNSLNQKLINLLKDKECFLTWHDLINISSKKTIKEVCNFLAVKSLSERGNISNIVNTLENQQGFLRLQ